MTTRQFFATVFGIVFLLSGIVVGLNIYVNSYGYYGDKQLGNAEVFNAHIAKYYHLKNSGFKPEAVVLGSSNSMRMLPRAIDSLFNLKAFNYGVYQATAEDFYCVSKTLVNDLQIKPRLAIICIDDWNFMKYNLPKDMVFKGVQNRLAYKSQLSQYLPDFSWLTLRWCQIKTAFSYEQLKYTLSNLKSSSANKSFLRDYIDLSQAFYADGTRKKYGNDEGEDVTQKAEQGKYQITEYLKAHHALASKKNPKGVVYKTNEDFKSLQPERLALLDSLVAFYKQNGTKVILNIMPVQPYFQGLLYQHTDYAERMSKLTQYLFELKKKHPNILLVKDNHEIKNFNGLSEHFFDPIHPTSVNSTLMLLSIKKELAINAF